ncbi:MAG: hypothetical protein CVT63_07920, partial [Candidatus Anoxymicrobium japonicum]
MFIFGHFSRLTVAINVHRTKPRCFLVRAAQKLGADGGFARYRITLVPWVWLLSRGRHNRVFQDKTV